jgi:Uri superfamily endonuclease
MDPRRSTYPATKHPGVYTLILQIQTDHTLNIGSLGSVHLTIGRYLYTGSALGPGGLETRISRHLMKEKRVFWHIDYLTVNQHVNVQAFIKAECLCRMECSVNQQLLSHLSVTPIIKFGSTDCSECPGHLLRVENLRLDSLIKNIMEVYLEAGLNPTRNTISSEETL